MRTLLRNIPSGLYFQGPDHWTNNPARAFDFKLVTRAIKFVEKTGLEEMEIAFAFDTPGITTVPLDRLTSGPSAAHLDPVLATLIASTYSRRNGS